MRHPFISELVQEFQFTSVFHLAALLSSAAAKDPARAHKVNVNGSVFLLEQLRSLEHGKAVKFLFPSSIAVYGMRGQKDVAGKVAEPDFLEPISLYGMNKLYIEGYGRLLTRLSTPELGIDFRSIRFPGLLSR